MQKLALFIAVAALVVAGWQVMESNGLRRDLDARTLEVGELRTQVARHAAALDAEIPETPELLTAGATGGADGPELTPPPPASRAALTRAVRDLREQIANQNEQVADLQKRVASGSGNRPAQIFETPKFVRDLDDAERKLKLSSTQRADLERIVEYAQRDLEDLRNIPNEDGQTWADITKKNIEVGGDGQSSIGIVMPDFAAIQKFRAGRVPGRNETYGEAEQRIRKDAKREARDLLSPDQQKQWDDTHTDHLFGSGGGMFSSSVISFSTVTADEESD